MTQTAITERTGKLVIAGTWACAIIVMIGSVTNAVLAYGAIGDNRALGLATGLAVDTGLCVALIGDRRLYAHGISSQWGRGLRITTAAMSLILNTGIAVRNGNYFMATLHAFLPILLVVLTEYGQDVLLKFTQIRLTAETPVSAATVPSAPQSPPPVPIPAGQPTIAAPTPSLPVPSLPTSPPAASPSIPAQRAAPGPPPVTTRPQSVPQQVAPPRLAKPARERRISPTKASRARQPNRRPAAEEAARKEQVMRLLDHEAASGVRITTADIGRKTGVSQKTIERYRVEHAAQRDTEPAA